MDLVYRYFLHITNGNNLLNSKLRTQRIDNPKDESLGISFHIAAADAKKQAPDLALVCGVRFYDYKRSANECTFIREPTVNQPVTISHFTHGIDAELVSLSVVNTQTMEEFARWTK